MGELPAGGAMLAVQISEQEAIESLAGFEGRVAVAAVNGPEAVVLSGDTVAIEQLRERFKGQGRRCARLRVSHAFHSQLMEPILSVAFRRSLEVCPSASPRSLSCPTFRAGWPAES